MITDPKTHLPGLIRVLEKQRIQFRILPAQSPESNALIVWLERSFPISYSQIAWSKVPSHRCLNWSDPDDLVVKFQEIVVGLSISSLVVVSWANDLCPSIEMHLGDVLRLSREIFEAFETSLDTWIMCREENWCIEMHHEGTLCRGRGRTDIVFLGVKESL